MERGVADGGSMSLHNIWQNWNTICSTKVSLPNEWKAALCSSVFSKSTNDLIPVLPLRSSMEGPLTSEEIWEALFCVSFRMAAGKNGLLPELKCCDVDLLKYICDLFVVVWEEEEAPKEWHDALLESVPRKWNITKCDNWRGISLLDIMGNFFGKILQRRYQELADNLLSDLQFSSGTICVDFIFNAQQLLEKLRMGQFCQQNI